MEVEAEAEATGEAEVTSPHSPHSHTSLATVPSMIWNPSTGSVVYLWATVPHINNFSSCLTLGHTRSHMSTGR